MNNIYYETDEILAYKDATKRINSLLWKFLYKRVQRRLKNSIITVENIRKIIFNKHNSIGCSIKAPLPYVMFRKEPIWYFIANEREYYIPLSIGFSRAEIRYDIVLIDGEIDLRNKTTSKKPLDKRLDHTPILFLKNFQYLEESFKVLLEHIQKEDEIALKR